MFSGGFPGFGNSNSGSSWTNRRVNNQEFYEILGVRQDASQHDIKKCYHKRALQLHPDKGGDTEEFKRLQAAYEVLSNPEERELYDKYGLDGIRAGGNYQEQQRQREQEEEQRRQREQEEQRRRERVYQEQQRQQEQQRLYQEQQQRLYQEQQQRLYQEQQQRLYQEQQQKLYQEQQQKLYQEQQQKLYQEQQQRLYEEQQQELYKKILQLLYQQQQQQRVYHQPTYQAGTCYGCGGGPGHRWSYDCTELSSPLDI